jgi:hypothetical protein
VGADDTARRDRPAREDRGRRPDPNVVADRDRRRREPLLPHRPLGIGEHRSGVDQHDPVGHQPARADPDPGPRGHHAPLAEPRPVADRDDRAIRHVEPAPIAERDAIAQLDPPTWRDVEDHVPADHHTPPGHDATTTRTAPVTPSRATPRCGGRGDDVGVGIWSVRAGAHGLAHRGSFAGQATRPLALDARRRSLRACPSMIAAVCWEIVRVSGS